ncbi:MAG TPA: hypothetical protein VL475_03395 [Planctomycetaceae bacterium]|nr:hypothetical protein [Planctomycetaceae bacterium]
MTTGPDRGRSLALSGELMRVGRAPQNDLVLSDPQLADHLASIVERDGRYAIITTIPRGLEIDGTEIPVERWVWLPDEAQIKVSPRTMLQFMTGNGAGEAPEPAVESGAAPENESTARAAGTRSATLPRPVGSPLKQTPGERPGSSGEFARAKRTTGERSERKSRAVARFITDGPGDPLVKLGEDGHLPELTLKEGHVREGRDEQTKQTSPALLAVVLSVSIGMTLLMLLMDTGGFGDNTALKAQARGEITQYYGSETDDLKPYQIQLRQARQARGRGDYQAERAAYREVLAQLRSEAKEKLYKYTGITGRLDYAEGEENRKSDRRLEELISILLSD